MVFSFYDWHTKFSILQIILFLFPNCIFIYDSGIMYEIQLSNVH